jgi:hypothetical protein
MRLCAYLQKRTYATEKPQSQFCAKPESRADQCPNPYHLEPANMKLGTARRGRVVEMGIDMDWVVRLGREEWQRFTYERPESNSLRLLGSVTRGAGMGALAVDEDGNYLQVNGDHVSPLNSGQLRRAVAAARTSDWRPVVPTRHEPSRVPVVVIKRRRVVPAMDAAKAGVS